MRKIVFLLVLVSGFVIAEEKKISLEQIHQAILALTESESEPYHVISDINVYDYYSRTVGKHK